MIVGTLSIGRFTHCIWVQNEARGKEYIVFARSDQDCPLRQVDYRVYEPEAAGYLEVCDYLERLENDRDYRLAEIAKAEQETWG